MSSNQVFKNCMQWVGEITLTIYLHWKNRIYDIISKSEFYFHISTYWCLIALKDFLTLKKLLTAVKIECTKHFAVTLLHINCQHQTWVKWSERFQTYSQIQNRKDTPFTSFLNWKASTGLWILAIFVTWCGNGGSHEHERCLILALAQSLGIITSQASKMTSG